MCRSFDFSDMNEKLYFCNVAIVTKLMLLCNAFLENPILSDRAQN